MLAVEQGRNHTIFALVDISISWQCVPYLSSELDSSLTVVGGAFAGIAQMEVVRGLHAQQHHNRWKTA